VIAHDAWRTIVLRRRLKCHGLSYENENGAPQLTFAEIGEATAVYGYSVLVTSFDEETGDVGRLYRDRGMMKTSFDELTNQWGWDGFTTQRCRLAARMLAPERGRRA
jgi:hypothetical protein